MRRSEEVVEDLLVEEWREGGSVSESAVHELRLALPAWVEEGKGKDFTLLPLAYFQVEMFYLIKCFLKYVILRMFADAVLMV